MHLATAPLSPVNSDYAFHPSSDVDYVSLFEQCGIPLADLSTHLSAELAPTTTETTKQWYEGTAPADDDPVALDNDKSVDGVHETKLAACQSTQRTSSAHLARFAKIDGLGRSPVSDLQDVKEELKANTVSGTTHHEAVEHGRRLSTQSPALHRHNRCDTSAQPATVRVKSLSPARRASRALHTPSPPRTRTSRSIDPATTSSASSKTKESKAEEMDFYAQRQYYAGAQLSSPVSMQSCPEEDDTFLYTATFSPEFNHFSGAGMNGNYIDSETMRRSMSTPFLGERSFGAMQTLSTEPFDINSCTDAGFSMEEVVPASNNSRWATGEYLMPHSSNDQNDLINAQRLSMNAARPTMKRKNRPMPIATNAPRSSGGVVPHTAPMDGRFIARSIERPMLSAKRSFEDFSEMGNDSIDVPPYRHISTPISKRARSSQGFGSSIPASPFTDSPLFSPVYNNGFSRGMDPEQLLLSSPPYSQSDFCSSPSYLMQSQHDDMGQIYTPSSLPTHDYSYVKQQQHEPLSAVDFEGMWPQKYAFERPPQINARPVIATPRSLTYGAALPMRKTLSKPRRSSAVKAISFCNYTAADKKTILSGVAPSGSNKKALTKAQEMNRSQSSSAIAV